MNILYCDCFSGISGDMFLGAMLDAGLPVKFLDEQFQRLGLVEYRGVTAERVHKGALAATLLRLDIAETSPHKDASGAYHHHPGHRHPSDIAHLIESSDLAASVQANSLAIFQKLAEAEARVHGVALEDVHFHEVGAADSILDIVGAALALDYFAVQAVYASALPLGSGQVDTQHGLLPVPAPATLELLRAVQAPITPSRAEVELVTPTGAAILAALAAFEQPAMRLQRVGIGAGRRDLDWPNVLRLMIGERDGALETHLEIETNIDDMNPQLFAPVMEQLFQAGALDVYFTPIYMKKNRPATRLSVIARKADEERLCDILLQHTSTLGVRVKPVWRHEAQREIRPVFTPYGKIPIKLKIIGGKVIQAMPEYDACVQRAQAAGVPVARVLQEATAASLKFLD